MKMIILEVFLNKKLITRAGSADLSVLAAIVNVVGRLGPKSQGAKTKREGLEVTLDVDGLTARESKDDEHLNWSRNHLKIGDEISVRILEADSADQPSERKSDRNVDELVERETFDWAKKKYFELKEKYEGRD
jgi:hypothetical protein